MTSDTAPSSAESLTRVDEEWLRQLTISLAGYGVEINYETFKSALGVKDDFVAKRVFNMYDKEGSGVVTLSELITGLQDLLNGSAEDKMSFIFGLFDSNNDGYLDHDELEKAINQSIKDTKAELMEHDAASLTNLFFQKLDPTGRGRLSIQQVANYCKQEGLEETLFLSIASGLSAKQHEEGLQEAPNQSCCQTLQNQLVYIMFWVVYGLILAVLFISKCIQERDKNWFIILAKGNGQVLNFTCVMMLLFMVRRTLTFLRQTRIGNFLPIDRVIEIHKITGHIIMSSSIFHTIMHIFNAALYLVPEFKSNFFEILFTPKAGIGWIAGLAPLTGVLLWVVFLCIYIPSMPFVRRRGLFEVFFWTHQMFYLMLALLFIHGPVFWKFLIFPLGLYLFERILRSRFVSLARFGTTRIREGIPLPSRVTHLIIEKPSGFKYKPGDYVFVNIPSIARWEWHPFTISSCPELENSIWLHVRGVGGWTNKLYDHYEKQNKEQAKKIVQKSMKLKKQGGARPVVNPRPPQPRNAPANSLAVRGTSINIEERLVRRERTMSIMVSEQHRRQTMRMRKDQVRINMPGGGGRRATEPTISIAERASEPFTRRASSAAHRYEPSGGSSVRFSANPSHNGRRESEEIYDNPAVIREEDEDIDDEEMYGELPSLDIADIMSTGQTVATEYNAPALPTKQHKKNLRIFLHGPYGAPSEAIYDAEHAILVAGGIGVTPFASILQSIMYKLLQSKIACPSCQTKFVARQAVQLTSLKKVDFYWVNRDRKAFEWFLELLSQVEIEQEEMLQAFEDHERIIDYHLYMTQGPKAGNMKAIGLNLVGKAAMSVENKDIFTGLASATHIGRPNWDKIFSDLNTNKKGKVTVFFCGPSRLGADLKHQCSLYGFDFKKEVF